GPLTHEGSVFQLPLPPDQGTGLGKPLKIINHPVRDRIPIFVASLGVKNVEMTAEIADGWLPHLFIPEKAPQVWGEALAAGKAKRSPELGELQIAAGGLLAIGEGEETKKLLDLARPMIALYVGGMGAKGKNFYNSVARRYGYEEAAERIQDLYLAGKKEEAAAAVPDEMVELTNLVGPESYVRERIEAFREAGVTHLNLIPVGGDPVALLENGKDWLRFSFPGPARTGSAVERSSPYRSRPLGCRGSGPCRGLVIGTDPTRAVLVPARAGRRPCRVQYRSDHKVSGTITGCARGYARVCFGRVPGRVHGTAPPPREGLGACCSNTGAARPHGLWERHREEMRARAARRSGVAFRSSLGESTAGTGD